MTFLALAKIAAAVLIIAIAVYALTTAHHDDDGDVF